VCVFSHGFNSIKSTSNKIKSKLSSKRVVTLIGNLERTVVYLKVGRNVRHTFVNNHKYIEQYLTFLFPYQIGEFLLVSQVPKEIMVNSKIEFE
jgi:hypothetical protein